MPVDESPTGFYIFFFLHIPAFRFFFFFYFLSFQELMKFLKNSFLLHERASPSYRRCHKWKNFLQKKNRKKKLFIRSSSIVQYKKKHAIHEILFIFNLNSKKKILCYSHLRQIHCASFQYITVLLHAVIRITENTFFSTNFIWSVSVAHVTCVNVFFCKFGFIDSKLCCT